MSRVRYTHSGAPARLSHPLIDWRRCGHGIRIERRPHVTRRYSLLVMIVVRGVPASFSQYTIGISGCGARKTFIVVCPEEGDGCIAAGPGRFIRE